MKIAKTMAGIATRTRAPRSDLCGLCALMSPPAEPALARVELRQAALERRAVEVGPQLVGEHELRVCGLPQQVVRDPLLAARSDDEVRVVHLGRVEMLAELLLRRAR